MLKVGTRTFTFGTIPAMDAIGVEVAIARVVGEPLFKAFTEAANQTGEGAKLDPKKAAAIAVGLIASKLDAKELQATMLTVFTYVSCDGQRVDINSHFTGRNRELWEVFIGALKFNFSDFLAGSLFDSLRAQTEL